MALLKFLKLDPTTKGFPHSSGPLSTIIPALQLSIAVSNEVKMIVAAGENKKEGVLALFKFPPMRQSLQLQGIHAAENGIAASLATSSCKLQFS